MGELKGSAYTWTLYSCNTPKTYNDVHKMKLIKGIKGLKFYVALLCVFYAGGMLNKATLTYLSKVFV